MTISEVELAQMKADLWERLRVKEKRIVALEREVEELRAALRGAVEAYRSGKYWELDAAMKQACAVLGKND